MRSFPVKRAVAEDAERLTALVGACDAHRGEYAPALVDYRVTAEYIASHRCA